jgi:hypothetical protein
MKRREAIVLLTMVGGIAHEVRGQSRSGQQLEPQPLCRGTDASGKVVYVPCGERRPKIEASWLEVTLDNFVGLRVKKDGEVIELSVTQILNALKKEHKAS